MRSWWDRTLEYLADHIAVYGWADPTSTMPPTWVDDADADRDHDFDADLERDRATCCPPPVTVPTSVRCRSRACRPDGTR